MIDANDTKTADLIGGVPKRRGRPSTGKAKTGAERMRAMRRRNLHAFGDSLTTVTTSGLLEWLAFCHRSGHASLFDRIVQELRRRMPDSNNGHSDENSEHAKG